MPGNEVLPRRIAPSDARAATTPSGAFLDLFLGDFVADEKVVQTAAMDLAEACARVSNTGAVGPTIVSPAELQNLQLEGGDDDASSSRSEE